MSDSPNRPGLSDHPLYASAKKQRDVSAALQVIDDVVRDAALDAIVDAFAGSAPMIVAPAAIPENSNNALAITYAQWLGHEFGLPICKSIFQARGPKRDGRGSWYRLACPPSFFQTDDEIRGKDVIIADDVLTLGGTMAALRSFIEMHGGRVVCMTALAHRSGSHVEIALASRTRFGLDRLYGSALDELWQEEFGHGTECLTEPEGQLLLARALGVKRIRETLHAARDTGDPR